MTHPSEGRKLTDNEIYSITNAVKEAGIQQIHPDKMEAFADSMVEKLKEEFGRLSDEEIEVKNASGGAVSVLVPGEAWVSRRRRQERLRKAAEEGGGVTTETPREET